MQVAERFVSINGEGAHAGRFCTFVRFVGCNLSCSYCDTKWACDPECDCTHLSAEQISEWVSAQSTPCVTLTGGEPTLQPDIVELIDKLVRTTDCFVEVETNGAVSLDRIAKLRDSLASEGFVNRIGFTMDCKSISSGMRERMVQSNYELLCPDDCVKFVVSRTEDLDDAKRVIGEYELEEHCSVYFSPCFGEIEPSEIVEYLIQNDMKFANVQVQLHKVIWPSIDRGV